MPSRAQAALPALLFPHNAWEWRHGEDSMCSVLVTKLRVRNSNTEPLGGLLVLPRKEDWGGGDRNRLTLQFCRGWKVDM